MLFPGNTVVRRYGRVFTASPSEFLYRVV